MSASKTTTDNDDDGYNTYDTERQQRGKQDGAPCTEDEKNVIYTERMCVYYVYAYIASYIYYIRKRRVLKKNLQNIIYAI